MSHQRQDLDTRRIAWSGATLLAALLVVLVVCFVLWRSWVPPVPENVHRPPEPRLQPDPTRDLAAYRHAQRNADYWGWVDREHGIARIPVERAMELMAKQPPETEDVR